MSPGDVLRENIPGESNHGLTYLIVDTESIPDGELIKQVKYPSRPELTAFEAIEEFREELRNNTFNNSDFIPVTFQLPIAIAVIRLDSRLCIQQLTCLDEPLYRSEEMLRIFWKGFNKYPRVKIVTFNGRGFDLPLLELGAFRHGIVSSNYFQNYRYRFSDNLIDLMEWMSNYGSYRVTGGLDLLSKMIMKPGKMEMSGDKVYQEYLNGNLKAINDYCLFDTLDTYFVFLRTRVMMGQITLEYEAELLVKARKYIEARAVEVPVLNEYLDHWKS
jgi:3'-5' exonuclease